MGFEQRTSIKSLEENFFILDYNYIFIVYKV